MKNLFQLRCFQKKSVCVETVITSWCARDVQRLITHCHYHFASPITWVRFIDHAITMRDKSTSRMAQVYLLSESLVQIGEEDSITLIEICLFLSRWIEYGSGQGGIRIGKGENVFSILLGRVGHVLELAVDWTVSAIEIKDQILIQRCNLALGETSSSQLKGGEVHRRTVARAFRDYLTRNMPIVCNWEVEFNDQISAAKG